MACGQDNPHHIYSVGEHTIHALQEIDADKVLRLTVLLHDFGKPAVKTTDERGTDHFHSHQAVSQDLAEAILKRLKFDNDTIRQVKKLTYYHDYHPALTCAGVRKAMHRIGEELFPLYLKVQRADILAQNPVTQERKLADLAEMERLYKKVLKEQSCFTLKQLAVTGHDLMDAGIPAGPELGNILNHLLEAVIEDPQKNERERLIEQALEFYKG